MLRILHDTNYDFIKLLEDRHRRHGRVHRPRGSCSGSRVHRRRSTTASSSPAARSMQVEFAKRARRRRRCARRSTRPGFAGAEIQQFGTRHDVSRSARRIRATARGDAQAPRASRTQIAGGARRRSSATTSVHGRRARRSVGPRVGAELQTKAIIAILISFLVTLIYLAFRFEWRFGVAAVIATAHDILTTLAFLAMMRLEVSLTVVAALLTVIGYSLNDTIIIFDRVRENLKKAAQGAAVRRAQPLDQRDAAALGPDARHGARRDARAADLRRRSDPSVLVDHGVRYRSPERSARSTSPAPILLWIEHKWPRAAGGQARPSPSSAKAAPRARAARTGRRSAERASALAFTNRRAPRRFVHRCDFID